MEKTKSTSWDSLKWFIKEIMKMYSSEPSYFSKKRVESGVAFVIGQWGMIYFLLEKISTMTTTDIAIWAGVEFAIGGYMINQIQKEKKTEDSSK
jgi:hypothetical protein